MADEPIESLGGKTVIEAAKTPYMDMLAKNGRCGMFATVPKGFKPGSEIANMEVLGYVGRRVVYADSLALAVFGGTVVFVMEKSDDPDPGQLRHSVHSAFSVRISAMRLQANPSP